MLTRAYSAVTRPIFALFVIGLSLGACAGVTQTAALTETDRQPMDQAVQQSLETDMVGQSRNWRNPDGGHLGTVIVLRTFTNDAGRPCRDYQQTVTVAGRTRMAYDTACRQPTGNWNSVNFGGLAGFDSYRPSYPSARHAYSHYYNGYPYDRPGHYYGHSIYGSRYHHLGLGYPFGYRQGFGY